MKCLREVRPRQQALQCDGCCGWQHRTCHTAISQVQYRKAVKTGTIDWICSDCSARCRPAAVAASPVLIDTTTPESPTETLPSHNGGASDTPNTTRDAPLEFSLSPELTPDALVTPQHQQLGLVSSLYDSVGESSPSAYTSPMSVSSASPEEQDVKQLPARDLGTFTKNSIIQELNLESTIPSPAIEILDTPETPAL